MSVNSPLELVTTLPTPQFAQLAGRETAAAASAFVPRQAFHPRGTPSKEHTMAAKRIGIIGNGNVGSALARGLSRAGREVKAVGKDKAAIRDTAAWADAVILAVPFGAVDDAVRAAGEGLNDKTVIDVTNALDSKMNLALGFETSGAEELQKKAPKARVVKAFNTVFAQHMDSGRLNGEPLTAFAAGDDDAAKADVLDLERAIGFDAVDAGPLRNARLLEPLGSFNIQLGYGLNMGTQSGFKFVHK
jgi:predicted dinucleotide-binding enzyme